MSHSLFEILHIIFKHKALVLGVTLTILVPVSIGGLLREPQYRASGKLLVTGNRAYFRLASDEGRPRRPEMEDINTEIENIQSRSFLTTVASIVAKESNKESPLVNNAEEKGVADLQEDTLTAGKIRAGLEVKILPGTTLIEVAYTDTNPSLAAAVVRAILEHYPQFQANLHQDPVALQFYEKQKQILEKETLEIEERFQQFQKRTSLIQLDQQRDQILDAVEQVRGRLRGTLTDLDQGVGKIAALEKELKRHQKQMVRGWEAVDPEAEILQRRLVKLELDRTALLQRYTEKDRKVKALASEIASVRKRINTRTKKRIVVGENIGPDPIYQSILAELSEQRIKRGQQQAKAVNLRAQMEEFTEEAKALNHLGFDFTRLKEELERKKEIYSLYTKKAEEARIAAAMDREQLVNVKVIDKARTPTSPIASGIMLTLLLAMVVGVGTGIGGALSLEFLRPTFHSTFDVERQLELPVIALIPDFSERS